MKQNTEVQLALNVEADSRKKRVKLIWSILKLLIKLGIVIYRLIQFFSGDCHVDS